MPEKEGVGSMTTSTDTTGGTSTAQVKTTATKAWVAAALSAILAFLSSIATALGGAETGFDSITSGQWLTAVIAAIVAFGSAGGVTYAIPNKPK
jgi:hypothetical protein